MYSHAKDTILSQVDILIVEHGLVRLRINIDATSVHKVRQRCSNNSVSNSHLRLYDFAALQLLVN